MGLRNHDLTESRVECRFDAFSFRKPLTTFRTVGPTSGAGAGRRQFSTVLHADALVGYRSRPPSVFERRWPDSYQKYRHCPRRRSKTSDPGACFTVRFISLL